MAEIAQAAGHMVQGIASFAAGNHNAKVYRRQAGEEERATVAAETRIRETARAEIGQQIAAQFSNGMMGGTGSALDSLTQSQINAALDALNVRRDGAIKAQSLRSAAKQAKVQGALGLVSGMLGAGSSVANNQADWAAARSGQSRPTGGGG